MLLNFWGKVLLSLVLAAVVISVAYLLMNRFDSSRLKSWETDVEKGFDKLKR
jgi:hypothetical protein